MEITFSVNLIKIILKKVVSCDLILIAHKAYLGRRSSATKSFNEEKACPADAVRFLPKILLFEILI